MIVHQNLFGGFQATDCIFSNSKTTALKQRTRVFLRQPLNLPLPISMTKTSTSAKRKQPFLLVGFVLAFLVVVLSSNSNGRATQSNAGNTGAPGENTCGQCHGGGAFGTVTALIEIFENGVGIGNPVTQYTPGSTYDMRVTITNSSGNPNGYGFQMTALAAVGNLPLSGYSNLASNVKQKTLTLGPQTGRTYVEQDGVTTNNEFTFSWTAPQAGTGTVNFFASGNAVNLNNANSADNVGATSLSLPEASSVNVDNLLTEITVKSYPNPVVDRLTIEAASAIAHVVVIGIDGRIVTEQFPQSPITQLDASAWATGMYMATITTAEGTVIRRIQRQ
jgi:hypothetical protein